MSENHPRRFVCSWIAWALAPGALAACAAGAATERPRIGMGEVTAENVYVRSGSSTNHYPVCKLTAGDRITLVGEQGDWYEVLPPDAAFSLISAEYVDTVDNVNGVLNGNNVRVRAGSVLDDYKSRRDVVQTKLSKGAEVSILGVNPDGFLRITPPEGVTMWINRQYVELVPDALVAAEREPAEGETLQEQTSKPAAAPPDEDQAAGAQTEAGPASPFAGLPETEHRKQLEQLDAEARAELSKPVLERALKPFLDRYAAIAEQEDDDIAQRYAKRRIVQLENMQDLIEAVRALRELGKKAELIRRDSFEQRLSMPEVVPPAPAGLDAQGELRVSALYPPGSHPRRYRLVDATGAKERTIGYVEFPLGSPLEAERFVGRYVGVRAATSRLQVGGVNPVPIYVASELVLLQPPVDEADSSGRNN